MIELSDVSKYYGRTLAINSLCLSIQDNGIYCLLGRNGAGKTTLMKLIAGHLNASAGSVVVNGEPVSTLHMPSDVHFIQSDAPQFNMKLRHLLAAAGSLDDGFDVFFALQLAARFKLDLDKRYKKLSFGMKVMTNTILGMASDRKVLLLDEPVLGFDAVMRKTFYDLLQESITQKPRVVLLSTHLIDEAASVAGKLIIIDQGRLLLYAAMDEVDEKAYCVTGPAAFVEQAVSGLNVIGETRAGGFVSKFVFDTRIEGSDQYTVSNLGLQDFFVSLVGDDAKGGQTA